MLQTVSFKSPQQREIYYATHRCQCFSGGFNNGKSFIFCLKSLSLLQQFANYRMIIAREKYTDLKRTTMQTFFKMCPTELVSSHNEQDGVTIFTNGSMIYWLHLDNVDENTLRGIEPNSIFVDQAEEMQEKVYDVLDGRLGRWDGAIVSQSLIEEFERNGLEWPRKNDRYVAPSYLMLACNPDTEFHFIYRKYHPDSPERRPDFLFVQGEWDRELGSEETYDEAIKRDEEWVDKFVKGKWGTSSASIHQIRAESLIEATPDLIQRIKEKGNLNRVLDHGSTAPTCCGWFASIGGVYIAYREYYVANQVISRHRKAIVELSGSETYTADYADPHIFDKASQAKGGLYSVADEYRDADLEGPPLYWIKADNNEFSTRNRINELLIPSNKFKHPITGTSPAPGLYFIKASGEYPNGCKEIIRQTGAQRKVNLGTIDGKSIWGDDRDDSITDHAYDVVRYFVAMHNSQPRLESRKPPKNSFAYFNAILKRNMTRANQAVAGSVQ